MNGISSGLWIPGRVCVRLSESAYGAVRVNMEKGTRLLLFISVTLHLSIIIQAVV